VRGRASNPPGRSGVGNTQLKIHLGRPMAMEYLVVHRGKRLLDVEGDSGEALAAEA
jgi:hypothetical protein